MAAWDNVEGFEFQHDLITPSLDRQGTCLSMGQLSRIAARTRPRLQTSEFGAVNKERFCDSFNANFGNPEAPRRHVVHVVE